MQNTYGDLFNIEIFGGSHTEILGVIIGGLPDDFVIVPTDLYVDIKRRQPGANGTTPRKESDIPIIEKMKDGRTRIMFFNNNINNSVYNQFIDHPRPSHADYTQYNKYGKEYDMTGGGMASGRMTLPLVAAGSVAKNLLKYYGLNTEFDGHLYSMKSIKVYSNNTVNNVIVDEIINETLRYKDSVGAVIECIIKNPPKFIGEPFFNSVESEISKLAFSIPGIKGIEFGDGFDGLRKFGSERNDCIIDKDGHTKTNNEGGINGGITNGNDIIFRIAVKPTASIFKSQNTYNFKTNNIEQLKITGRHDACIGLRVPVIAESIAAIALINLYLQTIIK